MRLTCNACNSGARAETIYPISILVVVLPRATTLELLVHALPLVTSPALSTRHSNAAINVVVGINTDMYDNCDSTAIHVFIILQHTRRWLVLTTAFAAISVNTMSLVVSLPRQLVSVLTGPVFGCACAIDC